jgi:hypothetical protein
VYVGDGNRDTHTRDSCNVEQRKSKDAAGADDRSKGYLGKQPDTGDHVKAEPGYADKACGAHARGAIGDCVRPKGHDGPHQGAHFYSFTEDFVATSARTAAENHSRCDHKGGYCEVLKERSLREPFSISDAKNEDGEWIMSPEQIRSEMNYGPGGIYDDPSDYYDPYEASRRTASNDGCTCATNSDGTKTTMLCPVHASEDPCWTMARVTGRRRQGTIIRGVCTNCGWSKGREGSRRTAMPNGYDFPESGKFDSVAEAVAYINGVGGKGANIADVAYLMAIDLNAAKRRVDFAVEQGSVERRAERGKNLFAKGATVRISSAFLDKVASGITRVSEDGYKGKFRCTKCGMETETDDLTVIGRNCSATAFEEAHNMVPTSKTSSLDAEFQRLAASDHPWTDEASQKAVESAIAGLSKGDSAAEVVKRLGEAFATSGGYRDSFDREHAFDLAAQATGLDYNAIYDAWLDHGGDWGAQASRRTAMPTPAEAGIEVGDIFYCSWGYDQTNIDFYEVTRLMGASVAIRPIQSRSVREEIGGEYLVAVPGAYMGGEQTKRIKMWSNEPTLNINSYSAAYPWNGQPKFTNSGIWGR